MNILVTGAAGYIGSVVTDELIRQGNSVIALDDLRQGHREAVNSQAVFIQADLADLPRLEDVFHHYAVEAVVHLAADSQVGKSMKEPGQFFQNNIVNGMNLLNAMLKRHVHKIVFSSTAAVYGEPEKIPIEENHATKPINPYGESKLIFERILHWYRQAYGLKSISLRYFNAAGASERFGEAHNPEAHLIPNILKVALGQMNEIPVFGTDYPTRDGSCIRDYVHVLDIAKAHILSLKYLEESEGCEAYNLGNGKGYSVFEVIEAARRVTGKQIPAVVRQPRAGDPAVLVASSKLAECRLGWQPEFPNIERIISSAWKWQNKHPYGYG